MREPDYCQTSCRIRGKSELKSFVYAEKIQTEYNHSFSAACLLYALFVVYPVGRAFWVSLNRWDGYARSMTFVGLDNFKNILFNDPVFWGFFKNTFFLLAVPGVITLGLALFFASVLSSGIKGSKLFRVAFFFPNIMSVVIVALLWSFVYNPSFGILNGLLRLVGLEQLTRAWLEPSRVIPALVAPIVWCGVGFYMILFLAGIQNIPQVLYEAAYIDGANSWQCFRHVTLPLFKEMLSIAIVFYCYRRVEDIWPGLGYHLG